MLRRFVWVSTFIVLLLTSTQVWAQDFFDLSWGDVLDGPEWVLVGLPAHRSQLLVFNSLLLADVPAWLESDKQAAETFFYWLDRRGWSEIQAYHRIKDRSIIAGLSVNEILYFTIDSKLVAVEVVFDHADPDRISLAIRSRYGAADRSSDGDQLQYDHIEYNDGRTKVSFAVLELTIESVEAMQAFGNRLIEEFMSEYGLGDVWSTLW